MTHLFPHNPDQVVLHNLAIHDNSASVDVHGGTAVDVANATVLMADCLLSRNYGKHAGAVLAVAATMMLLRNELSYNGW